MSHHRRHTQPDGPVSRGGPVPYYKNLQDRVTAGAYRSCVPGDQPSLFDPLPAPPLSPPVPTSHLAGAAAAKLAPTRRDQIIALLTVAGANGLTLYELAAALEVSVHTISGRLTELVRAQRITTTGDRRPSPFGSLCEVYCLAPSIFTPGPGGVP